MAPGEGEEPVLTPAPVRRDRRGLRATRAGRFRVPSTPFLLRLGMALACLPVVALAVAIHVGVERNDSTVRTVGREATRGISVAQALKVELAELDGVVVRSLLGRAPLNTTGFPDDYNAKRAELHDSLVLAALVSSSGSVYEQPLVNIDYVLSHYHALVKDAFAAGRDGDLATASETYGQAHQVMAETLLPEADFLDKANSYVLNDSYDTHTARSASTAQLILVSWLAVLAFLVLAQVLVAKRFRRVLNLGLALATVVAVVSGALTLNRLDTSSDHLTSAREQVFDSVHVLARASATVESARQAQGQFLLDPSAAADAQTDFDHHVSRLLRVQGSNPTDLAAVAEASRLPAGAGGYLARVASPGATNAEPESVREVMVAFGAFLNDDAALRDLLTSDGLGAATARYMDGQAYGDLNDAINAAQGIEQDAFDDAAGAAADAAAPLDDINLVSAPAILLLALLGLFQRLREYRA
jgi:hypothetical protein